MNMQFLKQVMEHPNVPTAKKIREVEIAIELRKKELKILRLWLKTLTLNTRTCVICNNEFTPPMSSTGMVSPRKTCGDTCHNKLRGVNKTYTTFGIPNLEDRGSDFNQCTFLSPRGIEYTTSNIKNFVRDNESLFDKVHVQWSPVKKGSGKLNCNAQYGLQRLSSTCLKDKRVNSWFGWKIIKKSGIDVSF